MSGAMPTTRFCRPRALVGSSPAPAPNVGIGGVTFRPSQKMSVSGDVEVASSGGAYFRTSLYNYQKVHAQARYQARDVAQPVGRFHFARQSKPARRDRITITSRSRNRCRCSGRPGGGKIGDFQGSYTRSALHSDIGYLDPANP